MELLTGALRSGVASLASYLAAHVLLCLVPAFFVAGGLSALVPHQSITRFLGPDAPKWVAYPAAAGAGSLLAVCSCTVQPLFAGIYGKGAGLGPGITFLFFAPAANILALSYTGAALGADFALARVVLSLAFGVGIGMTMALVFRRAEASRLANAAAFAAGEAIARGTVAFLLGLLALLVAGALKLDVLTAHLATIDVALPAAQPTQAALDRLVPVDTIKGDEGLTVQGAALLVLLLLIGATALRGLGKVDESVSRLTRVCLGLIAGTLVFAALSVDVTGDGLRVAITGRAVTVSALLVVLGLLARKLKAWDRQQWLWETWRFVRQIFPLLVLGVFLVGVIRAFIRPEWVQLIAGKNSLYGNLAGVVFGVFMYFPTLVEVPVAKMFLTLGMHPGPLIAYLMADPELSLQSILITSTIIGKLKAWTYVGLVAVFSTASGLVYGAWVDGASVGWLILAVAAFVGTLVVMLHLVDKRRAPSAA